MELEVRLKKVQYHLHDIKNSIFLMQSHVRKYKKNQPLDINGLEASLNKTVLLVNNAYSISQGGLTNHPGPLCSTQLQDILAKVEQELSILYKNMQFSFHYPLKMIETNINFNLDLFKQIIFNVIDNAHHSHASKIHIGIGQTPQTLVMSFKDNGTGYDKSSERVDVFHGLGQQIIRENMKALGGDCQFSKLKNGYCVDLIFNIMPKTDGLRSNSWSLTA